MRRAVVAAMLCAACQGQPAAPPPGAASSRQPAAPARDASTPEAASAGAAIGSGAPSPGSDGTAADGTGAAATGDGESRTRSDEPEVPDPSRVIAELGAIPAWQAVIDRAQLLGRRGQHGVVYGRVGPPVMVPAPPGALPSPGTPGAAAAAGTPAMGAPAGGSAAAGSSGAVPVAPAAGGSAAAGPAGAVPAAPAAGGSAAAGPAGQLGSGLPPSAVAPGSPAITAAPAAPVIRPAGAADGPPLAAGATTRPVPGAVAAAGPRPGAPLEPVLIASPYVWLIDDTEGNGALGIRIALGDKAKEGDRIAAGGAWQLDADRRWFWKADAVQPLPPAAPSELKDPPALLPNHVIATAPLPAGARMVSFARDNDLIYFQIVGAPPVTDGDGWLVADEIGSPVALVINLPGERPTYGGQDMRAADERWQLRRGQTYWLRIGRLRKHGDKPPSANARTAPVRLP